MLDILAGAKDLADVVGCTGLANPEFETTVSTPHLTKIVQVDTNLSQLGANTYEYLSQTDPIIFFDRFS